MALLMSRFEKVSFQGHTHIPGMFTESGAFVTPEQRDYHFQLANEKCMINVGSVGQPRDGDPRSCYVVYDEQTVTFRRVEYDIERTVSEIEAEPDLDDFLGHRLREGR